MPSDPPPDFVINGVDLPGRTFVALQYATILLSFHPDDADDAEAFVAALRAATRGRTEGATVNVIDVDCPACGARAGVTCNGVLSPEPHAARRTKAAGAIRVCVPGRTNSGGSETGSTYHARERRAT